MRLALRRGRRVEQRDHRPRARRHARRGDRVLVAVRDGRRDGQRRRCRRARARAALRSAGDGRRRQPRSCRARPAPATGPRWKPRSSRAKYGSSRSSHRCAARWRSTSAAPSGEHHARHDHDHRERGRHEVQPQRRVFARRRADRRDLRGVGHRDAGQPARPARRATARSDRTVGGSRNVLSHVARYSKARPRTYRPAIDAQRERRRRQVQDARGARRVERRRLRRSSRARTPRARAHRVGVARGRAR